MKLKSISLLLCIAASGCAHTAATTRPATRNTTSSTSELPPAMIGGGRAVERPPVYEEGMATYYGKEAQGGPTASGERFDMNELTAAHKKLRFGTRVLVERVDDGRSVVVRINDRGPYGKGRIIDVSLAAAKKLGMIERGVVRVRLRVVK